MWEGQLGSHCSERCETMLTRAKVVMGIKQWPWARTWTGGLTVDGVRRVSEEEVSGATSGNAASGGQNLH